MDRDNKFQNLFADDDNIMTIDKFVNSLTVMLKKYEVEKELPENCLYVRENFSPKEKKLTSWSVCIHEPYYPAPYGDDKYDKQIEVIVTFRKKDLVKDGLCCTFSVKKSVLVYANTSYFGDGYYTVKSACKGYFNKELREMTDYECIMLAGIPNAPSVYAPTKNPDLTAKRAKHVIKKMVENGDITQKEADKILEEGG